MSPPALPLSLSQREVWLDQSAWPDSAHLNIGGGAFLVGPLDLQRFRAALVEMIRTTDALRLAPRADGSQALLSPSDVEPRLEIVDVAGSEDPRAAMRAHWNLRITEPFALDGTPPWRFILLRASDELHGLSIQFHHLIMDGWGTSVVMQRWAAIDARLAAGQAGDDGDGQAPYTRFIEDSLAYRGSPAFERDAVYWQQRITALPPAVIDRRYVGSRSKSLAPARLAKIKIPRRSYNRLTDWASTQGSSAFNIFLTALVLYHARASSQSEIVVGVPALNRQGHRFRHCAGMFVGVLPIRVVVDVQATVSELAAQVGQIVASALRHQRYPLSELSKSLEAIRNNRDSLFDLLLSFERHDYAIHFGQAQLLESRQLFSGVSRFPLGVTVCEFHPDEDVELILEGSTACFAEGELQLLGRRLWQLVEEAVAQPQALGCALPVMPEQERWAVVEGTHQAIENHAQPSTVVAMFEHQAALRPEASALVWDGGAMDYRELYLRANLVATRLRAMGATRECVVALPLARGPAMMVGMFGVMMAGAAFLPLDADAPLARLQDLVTDGQCVALVVTPDLAERFSSLHHQRLVLDISEAIQTVRRPSHWEPPAATDKAYVIFTSGSTGRPKGVVVEHGTLARRMYWLTKAYAVEWLDRSAQATQTSFDPSLIEIMLPLVNGASVALPPPGRLAPESLADFALRHGVTIMAFVPSTLARFLDGVADLGRTPLRVACCGGDVLAPELAARYLQETGARLFNVYGPTEAAIFATAWECERRPSGVALPLGRPIDDTRLYVLDDQLRALPFGVMGDIYIGGGGLARGYLGQPELTAQAFVADPFVEGARMYRTGDRGWIGTDGNLYFGGRVDRQVKLRGYRIELGEIEAALAALPGVDLAAVKIIETQGRPMIHAWVCGRKSAEGSEDHLQALRLRLPDYMVPAGITCVQAMPVTATGKIDFAALPDPASASAGHTSRAPSTHLESSLLALWRQALRRDDLGVADNFFDGGGDSLAAVDLLARIEASTGKRVPMYQLIESPTVQGFAAAMELASGGPGLMVSLGRGGGKATVYLAASGHGDLIRFQNLSRLLGASCDLHMLQPPSTDRVDSIADLATLYAERIGSHHDEAPYIAGFSVGGIAAMETARKLKERGQDVRGLFLIDTVYPGAIWGRPAVWRMLVWATRNLGVQELSMNGRRLGAMFSDPGLVSQVMALKGYRPARFNGPTWLVKSSGLASWDRWLFKSWRTMQGELLKQIEVPGLHGSIFESGNVDHLAHALAKALAPVPNPA